MVLQRRSGRVVGLTAAAALSAALLGGSGAGAWADDTARGQGVALQNITVDNVELTEAALPTAIKLIQQKTGISIVIKPGDYGKVYLSVRRKPVQDVLKLMAKSAGADFWEEDGVYFIGPKGSAPKVEDPMPTLVPLADPSPAPVRYEKIRLYYTEPHAILQRLGVYSGPIGTLEDQLAANFTRHLMNLGQDNYRVAGVGNNVTVQPNNPSSASQTNSLQVAPAAPTGTPNFNQGNNADQSARRSGENDAEFNRGGQFGGGGFGGGGFQGGGGGGRFGGGQGGNFGGGQGGQLGGGGQGQGQTGGASGLLPDGLQPGDLLAYDADGSIIVRSNNEQAIRQLREIIKLLDVKPKQIMVRAEFVTVTQNDVSSFGINWNFQKVNLIAGVNTGFQTQNTAFIQYAAGNLQTQLSWILTTGRGKLVAAPMATTLNNVPVIFQNVQQVPIFLSQAVVSNNGNVVLAPTLTFAQAATGLTILPRINGDDTISLFGNVFVGDLGTVVTGPNGESAPTLLFQTAPVQRIIRNGDTMVIGGLTSKNNTVSTNHVPLLGDLPLLGTLFRSRSVVTRDSDLLVFITAQIIPDRQPNTALPGPGGQGGPLAAPGGGPGGGGGGVNP